MTVSVNRSRVQYTGNGSTTAFNVTFPAITQAEIVVTVTTAGVDSVKTLNTHYTLTAAPFSTGTVTFLTSPSDYTPANNTTITISRNLDFLQSTDYQANDALDATTLETAFDKATLLAQQLVDDKSRMLKFSGTLTDSFDSDDTITTITQSASDRASKYLGFDANGDITTLTSITGVTYTETSIAAGHILRYSGSVWVNSNILALDDTKLYFGTDSNISLEYDENGNDTLSFDGGDLLIEDEHNLYFGSNKDVGLYYNEATSDCLNINGEVLVEDDHKLYFGSGKDGYIEYDEDGNDTMVFGLPAGGGQILDDKPLYFGTNKDVLIEYDEAGDDTLLFQSLASTALNLGLYSSAGGANEDKWRISVADGGTMTFESKISGSWVAMMTLVPNGTATDSAITFAGDFTVSGDTTTVNTANLLVEDPLIVLSKNTTGGSPGNDCGLIVERGDLTNVGMIWDESADEFAFLSSTSEAGSTAGNINMTTYGDVRIGKLYEERSFLKRGLHQSIIMGS